jgi:hypothetical protein
MKKIALLSAVLSILIFTGCLFIYVYNDRNEVLIKGIDIDQTLQVAKYTLDKGGFDSILTIWAMRDQVINEEQAKSIVPLYFDHIDKIDNEFGIWHLAWAISDLYRNGDDKTKKVLEAAYLDAKERPKKLKQFGKIADDLINGEKLMMGDIHALGRAYAKSHLIVPGNKNYIQSYDEFLSKQKKEKNNILK